MLDELRDGLITTVQARTDYGVVADPEHGLDAAATARLRAERRPSAQFTLGPVREALDARWPPDCRAALARAVMAAPVQIRSFLLETVVAALDGEGGAITPARVAQAVRDRLA